jgi:hypothetical protein
MQSRHGINFSSPIDNGNAAEIQNNPESTCTNGDRHDSGYSSFGAPQTETPSKFSISLAKFYKSSPVGTMKVFKKTIPEIYKTKFLDMKVLYTEPLWNAVSKQKGAMSGDISMKLRFLGVDESTAKLFIVIQCDKAVLRRVKKFFAQEHVLQDLGPWFSVHIIDTAPARLSIEDVKVLTSIERRDTMCGVTVQLATGDVSRIATLGGVILIKKSQSMLYGLTAGHPLTDLLLDCTSTPLEPDVNDTSSGERNSDEDTDANSESTIVLDLQSNVPKDNTSVARNPPRIIGTIVGDSFHDRPDIENCDWAIIELESENWVPNLITSSLNSQNNEQINGSATDLFCSATLPDITDQPVVVITCHGNQGGILRSSSSILMMSTGKKFVDILDFFPNEDSG